MDNSNDGKTLIDSVEILAEKSVVDEYITPKNAYSIQDEFILKEARVLLQNQEQNIRLRRKIAYWVLGFMISWCVVVLAIVILNGLKAWNIDIKSNVLITICGGTTVSTISLVGFIVKGLFSSSEKESKSVKSITDKIGIN